MSWTQTRSSCRTPLPAQPNPMIKDEFIALDRGLLKHPSKVISWRRLTAAPGSDASAIHGRLDARVALLQSPILPAANPAYPQQREFYNVPVENTHTRLRQWHITWRGPRKERRPQEQWLGLPECRRIILSYTVSAPYTIACQPMKHPGAPEQHHHDLGALPPGLKAEAKKSERMPGPARPATQSEAPAA
jgi:hypothetical protein